jgi:hypothetical protein
MSDSNEFDSDEATDHLDPNIRAELRRSKDRAKEAEAAKAEVDSLKRELAFTKAGVPEDGVGALLRKAWDGDTDPEAIRKAAEEYGIFQAGQTAPQHDPVRDELERHRNIAGATGTSNSGPDPQQELLAAINGANSQEELMEVINRLGGESGLYTPGMR